MPTVRTSETVGADLFGFLDYLIFFSLLVISALIGVYYAWKGKSGSVDDYMLGGRRMPLLPVAFSLTASFVSGITLVGIPSETYLFGTQMYAIVVAISFCIVLHDIFYLPVVYKLKFKSFYEYHERRFDKKVRSIASFVFAMSILSHIPIVMYVPAIAFNQVTGVSVEVLAPVICFVCIFYTSIGGLKAVVWSDALQGVFTIISMTAVLILGVSSVGGVDRVLEINRQGERLEFFNMDIDPFIRNTFWTTAIGSIPNWLKTVSCHPSSVQRYISLPSYRHATFVSVIMCVGIVIMKSLSTATGLVIYAKYHDCDPVASKAIERQAQILPYYIMDVAKNWPGIAGLFISGVASTALSTMSTGLNTLSGTIYEDFLKGVLPWKQTDRSASLTMKIIVVVLGLITTALLFVVERLGPIVQVAISITGITTGVQLFIFSLGIFVPWANAKGALYGTIVGMTSTAIMMVGSKLYEKRGDIYYGTKVLSVDGCLENVTLPFNVTTLGHPGYGTVVRHEDWVPFFFRFSYLYYALVGFSTAMVTAILVSVLTGPQDPAELDPDLMIPQLRGFLSRRREEAKKRYQKVHQLEDLRDGH